MLFGAPKSPGRLLHAQVASHSANVLIRIRYAALKWAPIGGRAHNETQR